MAKLKGTKTKTLNFKEMELRNYMQDGADAQSRAILALIQNHVIKQSWDWQYKQYAFHLRVGRWHNGREQGYIVSLCFSADPNKDIGRGMKQLNIAFFEHRNSDAVHLLVWEQFDLNPITIQTAKFPAGLYESKYDTSKSFQFEQIAEAAEFITAQFDVYYDKFGPNYAETTKPQN